MPQLLECHRLTRMSVDQLRQATSRDPSHRTTFLTSICVHPRLPRHSPLNEGEADCGSQPFPPTFHLRSSAFICGSNLFSPQPKEPRPQTNTGRQVLSYPVHVLAPLSPPPFPIQRTVWRIRPRILTRTRLPNHSLPHSICVHLRLPRHSPLDEGGFICGSNLFSPQRKKPKPQMNAD